MTTTVTMNEVTFLRTGLRPSLNNCGIVLETRKNWFKKQFDDLRLKVKNDTAEIFEIVFGEISENVKLSLETDKITVISFVDYYNSQMSQKVFVQFKEGIAYIS